MSGAVTCLVLTLLTACEATATLTGGRATDGPVTFTDTETVQRAGLYAREGDVVVFGATTVANDGEDDATLQAGLLLGDVDPDGAEVVEVRVADLGPAPARGDLLAVSKWPAKGWRDWWESAQPVEGATLGAGRAIEMIYMVEVNRRGDWYWSQSALDYEVDGTDYRTVTNFGFQVCPPRPAPCDNGRPEVS